MIDSQSSAVPPPPPVASPEAAPALPRVSARYIWLMVLAQFGVFTAFITPLGISLSVKVAQLAPGHEEYLGYITGAGAATVVLTGPLLGVLSDRTRSRLPLLFAGSVTTSIGLGMFSAVDQALALDVLIIGATAAGKNYSLLFIVAAVCTVLSGLVVLRVKSVR